MNVQAAHSVENAALQADQEAQAVVKLLTNALEVAQADAANAEVVAQGAQQALSDKESLIEAAKAREEQLVAQLNSAKHDMENTRQACAKASAAAHAAKDGAMRNKRQINKKGRRKRKK